MVGTNLKQTMSFSLLSNGIKNLLRSTNLSSYSEDTEEKIMRMFEHVYNQKGAIEGISIIKSWGGKLSKIRIHVDTSNMNPDHTYNQWLKFMERLWSHFHMLDRIRSVDFFDLWININSSIWDSLHKQSSNQVGDLFHNWIELQHSVHQLLAGSNDKYGEDFITYYIDWVSNEMQLLQEMKYDITLWKNWIDKEMFMVRNIDDFYYLSKWCLRQFKLWRF